MSSHLQDRGNILFMILIAIIVFAALGYAVIDSLRGGGKNASGEKVDTVASQIIQPANLLGTNVQRFMLVNGYQLGKFDIFTNSQVLYSGNIDDCTTASCNLLSPSGGNATPPPLLPTEAYDEPVATSCASTYANSNGQIRPFIMIASVKGIGTDLPELILGYCGLKRKVCEAININMGIMKAGDAMLDNIHGSNSVDYMMYGGARYPMPTSLTPNRFGSQDARETGQRTFCGKYENAWGGWFYHVLAEQ